MSKSTATAELIEDRGEAAAGEEFFRSRPFLAAEGVTHTLRIVIGRSSDARWDSGDGSGAGGEDSPPGAEHTPALDAEADIELLAPLIVRRIGDGPERDAISPYGYPGLVRGRPLGRIPSEKSAAIAGGSAPAAEVAAESTEAGPTSSLDPATIDFSATGLVSVFLRHTLGPPPLAAATERIAVQIADPTLAPKSRPSDRRQIRRNLEAGYRLALVPGAETEPSQRAGFLDLYEQTMRRAGAAEHYFFAAAYFDRILEADRTWLALAHAPGGELAAASIAVVSDGYLHYYLSGSADSHLSDSPMKNIVSHLLDHAASLALPLNLGGGLAANDALEEFKRGFANRSEPWQTSELICDKEKYEHLSAGASPGGFFPAYRA